MPDQHFFKQVLFVGPNYKRHNGGMGAVLEVYQRNIDNFRFVATQDSRRTGVRGYLFSFGALLKMSWMLATRPRLRIVHIHSASKKSLVRKYVMYLIARRIFGKKVVVHIHGAQFHWYYQQGSSSYQRLTARFLSGADHVVCLSAYWQQFFATTFPLRGISILNNPVDVPASTLPREKRTHLELLFLGKIGDNKGVFDLLHVIAMNQDEYRNNIKLRIGGNGEIARLQDYIVSHKIGDMVEYAGWVHGDLKHVLLSNCDVLLLPSYNEGLPISVLEAMSYGKPVISTTVGGIPEIITNGENGFLCNPGDKKALKQCLDFMMQYPAQREQMGQRNLERIRPFTMEYVMEEMEGLYKGLLKSKRS